jgi:nitrite reductase/ring-hydroxylating ferredoxin subunit
MDWLKRVFGICATSPPKDSECWDYSEGKVVVQLGRAPELYAASGRVRLEGKGLPERILLLHGENGEYYALRNKCTHMGRRIDPVYGSAKVRCCSVFRSTYDYSGEVISGPAKGPLKHYRVQTDGDRLIISLD